MINVQTPVVQKEIPATGRTQDAASARKTTTKTQVGDATQPVVVAKNGAATVHPIADEIKPAHGVVVQAPTLLFGQTTAVQVAPVGSSVSVESLNFALSTQSDTGGVSSGTAIAAGRTSPGGITVTADSSGSKNTVHGAKSYVSDRETTTASPVDPAAAAKPEVKSERLQQPVAANAAVDSDTKTRTMGEAVVATVHALASGGGASSGSAPPVIAGLTKQPGGEASSSTGSSSNGPRVLDGSGGVTQSATEPMPRTLSASPTALEVGIPDGTHGWLKVRAEMADGGVVNASVSAASPASQEMLHRELPSLTAYLQSERWR